jgi:hypothetical protein
VATTNLSFAFLYVNLISKDDEWEVFGIMWACLDEEFISPAVEGLKRLGTIHIIDKNTTISSTIECNSK